MYNLRATVQQEWNRVNQAISVLHSQVSFSDSRHELNGEENVPIVEHSEIPGGILRQPPNNIVETQITFKQKLKKFFNRFLGILTLSLLLLFLAPLYIIYRITVYLIFFLVAILGKLQMRGYKSISLTDPNDIAKSFVMEFEDKIQRSNISDLENQLNNNRPHFLECSYSQALYIVKKDIKWLLVYIDSPHSSDSSLFVNNILINEQFLSFVNSKNILIWGGDITKSESFQIANQFGITKLPFLGFFCMTRQEIPTSSGIQRSAPMLSLVSKIQGYKDPDLVLKKLKKAFKKYNPGVLLIRSSNPNGIQVIPPMTTAAPPPSPPAATTTTTTNHIGSNSNDQFLAANDDTKQQWLAWRTSLLPTNTRDEESAKLAIRLPDGTRQQISLPKDATLDDLYAYVECKIMNEVELIPGGIYREPLNYIHHYDFNLTVTFPQRRILEINSTRIDQVDEIYPNGTLIIEI